MLLPEDKICKIDLKDTYFAIALPTKSRKYVDSSGKTFYMSLVVFALGFLRLLWSLQSY